MTFHLLHDLLRLLNYIIKVFSIYFRPDDSVPPGKISWQIKPISRNAIGHWQNETALATNFFISQYFFFNFLKVVDLYTQNTLPHTLDGALYAYNTMWNILQGP